MLVKGTVEHDLPAQNGALVRLIVNVAQIAPAVRVFAAQVVQIRRSEERRVGKGWRATRWPRDWSSDVCSSDLLRTSPERAASARFAHQRRLAIMYADAGQRYGRT